jgi:hypothetical protein
MFVHEQDHGDYRIYAAAIEKGAGCFISAVAVNRVRGAPGLPVTVLRNDCVGDRPWDDGTVALREAVAWAEQALTHHTG